MRTHRLFRSVLFMLCMMTAFVFLTVTAQAEPQASTVTVKTGSGKTYLYDASGKKYKELAEVQELPEGSQKLLLFSEYIGKICVRMVHQRFQNLLCRQRRKAETRLADHQQESLLLQHQDSRTYNRMEKTQRQVLLFQQQRHPDHRMAEMEEVHVLPGSC